MHILLNPLFILVYYVFEKCNYIVGYIDALSITSKAINVVQFSEFTLAILLVDIIQLIISFYWSFPDEIMYFYFLLQK